MNADAMRKKLGPVADDIAMFLSGIDGFPHDLRDFSAVGAGSRMSIVGFKMPSHLLPHSFDKHINNMLRHDFCDPGFRGFLVVQGMVQPLVETGSTGSHGSGQVPVLTGSAGGAPPCILACRGVRGFRGFTGFKVAKVHVTTGAGFLGFGEVAVCAGPTIWFVGHFLLI